MDTKQFGPHSLISNIIETNRRFSKLTKFCANCHLWSCFVEHKLQHPSDSPALVVLWYSSGLISQRWGLKSQQRLGNFLIFKNYLCKLPIGNKFQLGKTLIGYILLNVHVHIPLADPGGRRWCVPPPPNRINFFHFCICFRQKVYVSEVGAPPPPPNGSAPPPTENPGSATAYYYTNKSKQRRS